MMKNRRSDQHGQARQDHDHSYCLEERVGVERKKRSGMCISPCGYASLDGARGKSIRTIPSTLGILPIDY